MSQHEGPDGVSVIHDIGYRRYTGTRLGAGSIGRSLFRTGLLNAYGFGRSGKAKALPLTLLVMMTVPAAILVAIMVFVSIGDGLIDYSAYPVTVMLLIVVFVAAQAPVLFSRDLRSGAIVLYLARPLSTTTFSLVRWLSLFVAVLLFILIPLVVLYVGALAAEADVGEQTSDFARGVLTVVLLSALLATMAGLVAASTTRRGLAIGGSIVALLVSTGVASAVKAIAMAEDNELAGQLAGLISPFTLVDGLQRELLDGSSSFPLPPDSAGMTLLYVLVWVLVIVGGLALVIRRYRQQANR